MKNVNDNMSAKDLENIFVLGRAAMETASKMNDLEKIEINKNIDEFIETSNALGIDPSPEDMARMFVNARKFKPAVTSNIKLDADGKPMRDVDGNPILETVYGVNQTTADTSVTQT